MLSNTNVKLTDVKLTSNAPFFGNRAVSGKYQRRYTGLQYYDLEFNANYMAKDISIVQNFIAKHMYGRPLNLTLVMLVNTLVQLAVLLIQHRPFNPALDRL